MNKTLYTAWSALLFLVCLPPSVLAADYWVAPTGNDLAAGSQAAPWKTLQHAADVVGAGDTVHVLAGHYQGFNLFSSGTASAPIRFVAVDSAAAPNPAVIIDQNNGFTNKDRVNLEGASYVEISGFTVLGTGDPATSRACIRVVGSASNPARFVTVRRTRCDRGGRWGIFSGFAEDFLIERNETSRAAAEHGIYVSNSGDRPIIRGNDVWGNHSNGIHMNGDLSQGGDGIISGALVEQNILHGNGNGDPTFGAPGGSAINCDGVRDSTFRNNVLYDNHKSGISLYSIDGAGGSTGNVVVNNTVWMASDARWALNIQDGSTSNQVRNNVLFNDHPTRGAIDVSTSSLPGLVSDYNVVKDRFSIDGNPLTLAAWKVATGQDAHSKVATPLATFANAALFDLDLAAASPALDAGTPLTAPAQDVKGKPRPFGAGFDVGAYEHGSCFGSAQSYGSGTPGAGQPTLLATGCPDIGDLLTLAVAPGIGGVPAGVLLLGSQPAQIAALGGTVLVAATLALPLSGPFSAPVSVPVTPGLVGASVYLQALYIDALAPQGVAMSAGLVITLG